MSAVAQQYRKLGGVGIQAASYTRLYLGNDHILQVSAAGFNERYKRFYFRDVQAFIVMSNSWWLVEMIVLACLSLGSFAIALGNSDEPAIFGVFVGIGAVFAAFFIWSVVRGQSCRTYVRTAVQMETLPSLNRLRKARQVIASLQPLVETSQAALATTQPESAPSAAAELPPSEPTAEPPTS
jgi:hypothetical protein